MRNYITHHAPKSHLAFAHRRIIEQAYNANLRRPKKDRRPDRPPSPLPPLVAPDRRVGRHPLSTTNCLTICADFGRFCRLLSIAIECSRLQSTNRPPKGVRSFSIDKFVHHCAIHPARRCAFPVANRPSFCYTFPCNPPNLPLPLEP